MYNGIIDQSLNPFTKDSWVKQGYSFTPNRQSLLPILFKRTVREIKVFKEENECSYPAFLAIRWGFASISNEILLPTYKWNHPEYYDGFGEPLKGYSISESMARWENDFNAALFEIYDLSKNVGYPARRYLMKIRNDGGIKSAKYWLNPSKKYDSESKGFIKLKELGKLGISLEAVVLKYPFNNLFTNAELEVARTRLVKARYNGPELQEDLLQKQVTEEIHDPETYPEGSKHVITVNAYERNPEARRKCIQHFGTTCFVCGFNFENFYGSDFRDFIHIHHLVLLSSVGDKYIVDPIKDLIPVCPNCHAAIHRKNPPLTIEQIKLHVLNTKAKP